MASSLFGKTVGQALPMAGRINNTLGAYAQIKKMVPMLKGQNPDQLLQMFAQKNPQFAQFVRANQGKSPQQIAADYGIDMSLVQQLLK